VTMWRRRWAARVREALPERIAAAEQRLAQTEQKRAEANVALAELRREAPAEVWENHERTLRKMPETLTRYRKELDEILLLPRNSYGELRRVDRMRRRWLLRMDGTWSRLGEAHEALDAFRSRAVEARQLLESIPGKLVRLEAEGVPGGSEGLLRAAGETYRQALAASAEVPANWLLVYDLLADVAACIERIENPYSARYRPVRYWQGGAIDSPAAEALALMYAASAASASSAADTSSGGGWDWGGGGGGGSDPGGGGGGGDFGGFGGGDTGGGGASSGY